MSSTQTYWTNTPHPYESQASTSQLSLEPDLDAQYHNGAYNVTVPSGTDDVWDVPLGYSYNYSYPQSPWDAYSQTAITGQNCASPPYGFEAASSSSHVTTTPTYGDYPRERQAVVGNMPVLGMQEGAALDDSSWGPSSVSAGCSSWENESYGYIQNTEDIYGKQEQDTFDPHTELLGATQSNMPEWDTQSTNYDTRRATSHFSDRHCRTDGSESPLDYANDEGTDEPSESGETSAAPEFKLQWLKPNTPESMQRKTYGLGHDPPEGSGSSHQITTKGHDMQSWQKARQNDGHAAKGAIWQLGDYPPSIREQFLSSAKTQVPGKKKSRARRKRPSWVHPVNPTQRTDISDQLTRLLRRKKNDQACNFKEVNGDVCKTNLDAEHFVSCHLLPEARSWLEAGFEQSKLERGLPWIFRNRRTARLVADYLLVCGEAGCFDTFTRPAAVKRHRENDHGLQREPEDPELRGDQEWRFEFLRLLKVRYDDEDEPGSEDEDDRRETRGKAGDGGTVL